MTDHLKPEQTPEQHYFADPQMDRMFGLFLTLAGELYTTRQRLARLIAQLEESGTVDVDSLNALQSVEKEAALKAEGDVFMDRIFRALAEHGTHQAPLRSEWNDQVRQP